MTAIKTLQSGGDRPRAPRPSVFDDYITEAEYARQRGVSVRTCQRDRALRQAPPHVILGNRVYYRVDAVRQWLETRERATDKPARRGRLAGRR